jgi:hypothetical protein
MMRPPNRDTRSLAYFDPDTFVLVASHAVDFAPERVVEELTKARSVVANKPLQDGLNRLLRSVRKGERLPMTYRPDERFWAENREDLPPIRGRNQSPPEAISLVFGDLPGKRRPRAEREKALVGLVNDVNAQLQDVFDDSEVVIQALVPNWLCNSTPKVIGTGGPGARPVAAPPLDPVWHASTPDAAGAPFGFHSPTLTQLDQRAGDPQGVEVAILDTAPTAEQLDKAYQRWGDEHPLLRALLEPNARQRRLRVSYAADFLAGTGIKLPHDTGIKHHEYTMEDHGLFAAGIVHTLAPTAELHLVEVLNHWGVGSLETIARGVEAALARRRDPKHALVINCSLMLSVPRPEADGRAPHRADDFPWTLDTTSPQFKNWTLPLRLTCDRAMRDGALIAAAAGNDAELTPRDVEGPRPPARYPAAFAGVVGVGALTAEQIPAGYSNFSDEPHSKGLVTFGGDTAPVVMTITGETPPLTANVDHGVLGVYVGDLPNPNATVASERTGRYPYPVPNKSGWARWAGTSFATPIISGVLARTIAKGTPAADAEQALRDAEADVSALGEQTFTVVQG